MALNTPCEEWPQHRDRDGYGRLKRAGRTWRAHVWTWVQAHGSVPDGLCVLHHCDNPPCVNVDHSFLGTIADNNRDRAAKGRSAHFPYRAQIDQAGEQNGNAKLTDAQVADIRAALVGARQRDGTQAELAEQYGVSRALITLIKQERLRPWR